MSPHPQPSTEEELWAYCRGSRFCTKSHGEVLKTEMPGPPLRDSHLTGLWLCPDTGMLKSSPCIYDVSWG